MEDGNGFHQLNVHYFDRLLQKNITSIAVCDQTEASPLLVTCTKTHVTVTLPRGTQLRKVRTLGKNENLELDKLQIAFIINAQGR